MSEALQLYRAFRKEYGVCDKQGVVPSYVEGVNFFWSVKPVDFSAMVYPSGIGFILNGAKIGVFGEQQFNYDSEHFLIVTVSTPLICQTLASESEPVFGLFIQTNSSDVKHLVASMGGESALPNTETRGVEPVALSAELSDSVVRLANSMLSKQDSAAIGESQLREVLYRVLQSPHGRTLHQAMQVNTPENKIALVVDYIKQSYSQRIEVSSLADMSNMSASHFHREFKLLTGTSPIQFIKQIRLSKARNLIVHDCKQVTVAADEVGYRNLSQFHRDFKTHFKVTPRQASTSGYAEIDRFVSD
ncbi:AraC family transcriptional regulator [Paraferrimonas sedimenticola]|uniref:AraC family transcriptional regulator n=1 Tax=Paraferrimonas sedimenticola TaxID=375674 RepID=UPI001472BB55|nr:AraC family transcriptional regulator [Paraferrimonas sedimenticola]